MGGDTWGTDGSDLALGLLTWGTRDLAVPLLTGACIVPLAVGNSSARDGRGAILRAVEPRSGDIARSDPSLTEGVPLACGDPSPLVRRLGLARLTGAPLPLEDAPPPDPVTSGLAPRDGTLRLSASEPRR